MQPDWFGWFAIRGSARQGKMRDKQGRDDPLVPVMPEVAVQSDGGLRRPAQEAARPAAPVASADATTALEAALSARVKCIYPPPPYICSSTPRLSNSCNPLPTAHLPLHSTARPRQSSALLQAPGVPPRLPQGACASSAPLFPPTPPASARTGHFRLERTCRSVATPAPVPGATHEVTHVQP